MEIEVRRTYKYRIYTSKKTRHLHHAINIGGMIWNHCLALQKRYYRLTGKYIQPEQMKAHIAKLRREVARFEYWQEQGSQAVQDIIERQDKAWQRFFAIKGGRPRFQKVKKYRSFTLKQAGWKLLGGNKVRLLGRTYKYVEHRELAGEIKTVTVKRDSCGRLWLCFSVVETLTSEEIGTGEIGGFDFGMKQFLTDSNGAVYLSAEYLKESLGRVQALAQSVSRKKVGSNNRQKARWLLNREQIRVADKRRDAHFKLANDL